MQNDTALSPEIQERLRLANDLIEGKLQRMPEKLARLYRPGLAQLQILLRRCLAPPKEVETDPPITGGKKLSPDLALAAAAAVPVFPRLLPFWGAGLNL